MLRFICFIGKILVNVNVLVIIIIIKVVEVMILFVEMSFFNVV